MTGQEVKPQIMRYTGSKMEVQTLGANLSGVGVSYEVTTLQPGARTRDAATIELNGGNMVEVRQGGMMSVKSGGTHTPVDNHALRDEILAKARKAFTADGDGTIRFTPDEAAEIGTLARQAVGQGEALIKQQKERREGEQEYISTTYTR